MTYPLIGNYGINYSNLESTKSYVRALHARACVTPSNWASEARWRIFLLNRTSAAYRNRRRALTRKIREAGTLANYAGAADIEDFEEMKNYSFGCPVSEVSCRKNTV